jgi:two-component system cell cycle response regulator
MLQNGLSAGGETPAVRQGDEAGVDPTERFATLADGIVPATTRTMPVPDAAASADAEVLTERTWKRDTPPSGFVVALDRRERATLTMLAGPHAGATFPIEAEETVIGRSDAASVCIEEASISRMHARILRTGDGYAIEDLSSTNGTFVSARRVIRAALCPGDRVQIGATCVFRFAIVDEKEETLQRRLYESSTRDSLTGAFNRRALFEQIEAEVAHARRSHDPLSLLMIDVDHFKRINDAHGHGVGDQVLRSIAECAAATVRAGDVFARYGGEEFATLARAASLAEATALAERLRAAVAALRVEVGTESLGVTISVGVAALDECEPISDVPDFVSVADGRLYIAKMQGRDRVCGAGDTNAVRAGQG